MGVAFLEGLAGGVAVMPEGCGCPRGCPWAGPPQQAQRLCLLSVSACEGLGYCSSLFPAAVVTDHLKLHASPSSHPSSFAACLQCLWTRTALCLLISWHLECDLDFAFKASHSGLSGPPFRNADQHQMDNADRAGWSLL